MSSAPIAGTPASMRSASQVASAATAARPVGHDVGGPSRSTPSTPGQATGPAPGRRRAPTASDAPDGHATRLASRAARGRPWSRSLKRCEPGQHRLAEAGVDVEHERPSSADARVRPATRRRPCPGAGAAKRPRRVARRPAPATSWLSWPCRKVDGVGALDAHHVALDGTARAATAGRGPGSPRSHRQRRSAAPAVGVRPRRARGHAPAAGIAASRARALLWHSRSSCSGTLSATIAGAGLHRRPPVGADDAACGWRWRCRCCRRSRGSRRPRRRGRAWSARGRR